MSSVTINATNEDQELGFSLNLSDWCMPFHIYPIGKFIHPSSIDEWFDEWKKLYRTIAGVYWSDVTEYDLVSLLNYAWVDDQAKVAIQTQGHINSEVFHHKNMCNVVILQFEPQSINDHDVNHICQSPHLTNLRLLDLRGNHITNEAIDSILSSPHLSNLVCLKTDNNDNEIQPHHNQ